jgi:AAA domain/UvrD-like helicase C-terminal domain
MTPTHLPRNGQHRSPETVMPKGKSILEMARDQVVSVEDDAPHVVVEALAGTGKTTTLVGGLQVLFGLTPTDGQGRPMTPSPQQKAVWDALALSAGKAKTACFVAFNKAIAEELKRRIPAGCEAMTNHGLGFRAVGKAFRGVRVDEYRVSDLIGEILGGNPKDLRKKNPVLFTATQKLVSLCKMNLVDAETEEGWVEAFEELADHYDVETESEQGKDYREEVFALVPKVLELCADVGRGMRIDFDDMVWLPIRLGLTLPKYDILLVDEAQDLNRCQQELAKRCGKRLVLCGDRNQAIYGFAGADSDSLPRMTADLGGTDRNVIVLPLTVTRRCGKAIVEAAKHYVPTFEAHESNPAGSVGSEKLAKYRAGVQDGDMVICRTNAPLVSECFKFIRAGKKANIQGRDVGKGLVSTVRKVADANGTVAGLITGLGNWLSGDIGKEQAKRNPSEARIQGFVDRYECLVCFTEDLNPTDSVDRVIAKIESVFTDDKNARGIRLSSGHKSKGLEADRVFILDPESGERPNRKPWEIQQGRNLRYVMITRAIESLTWVSIPKEQKEDK